MFTQFTLITYISKSLSTGLRKCRLLEKYRPSQHYEYKNDSVQPMKT